MKNVCIILFGIGLILFGMFWIGLLQLGGESDFLYLFGVCCAIVGILFCLTGLFAMLFKSREHKNSELKTAKKNGSGDNIWIKAIYIDYLAQRLLPLRFLVKCVRVCWYGSGDTPQWIENSEWIVVVDFSPFVRHNPLSYWACRTYLAQ